MNETVFPSFTTTMSSSTAVTVDQAEEAIRRELALFQENFATALKVFEKIDTLLLCLGIIGNLAALTTMIKSRSMRTPSFVYHKILVTADLIFCVNYLLVKFVDQTQTDKKSLPGMRANVMCYYSPVLAFYTTVLNRALSSSCGYIVLYMSLSIGLDRFIALWLIRIYEKFNKKSVAWILVTTSLALSVLVHSWATWFERKVIGGEVPAPTVDNPNATVTVYISTAAKNPHLHEWIIVKDIYNMAVRVSYPFILTLLTSLVLWGFNVQQKKKRTMVAVNKRQNRRERCLFYLMIAVVILACIQVIPREAKRLLELIYPYELSLANMGDLSLPLNERLKFFYIVIYGHEFSKIILNTLTAMDRSLVFYLYFTLNHSFRKEVLRVFHLTRLFYRRRKSLNGTGNSRKASSQSNISRRSSTTKSPRHSLASPLIRRSSNSPYDFSEFSSTGF